jgi:hypothetical protein
LAIFIRGIRHPSPVRKKRPFLPSAVLGSVGVSLVFVGLLSAFHDPCISGGLGPCQIPVNLYYYVAAEGFFIGFALLISAVGWAWIALTLAARAPSARTS